MKRSVILGTAGHIDHGKTALVRALTGIDTDRLKEERRRGITIELGFAWLERGDAEFGIVDVPGHERFIKSMVAGAGGIDVVMLVVAADEGVMPQTREHLDICGLLGVQRGLVALTKIDLVEPAWLDLVLGDLEQALAGSFLAKAPIIPCSAHDRRGIEPLADALVALCADLEPKNAGGVARLPLDRVFSLKGFGTVVTGTLVSGTLRAGQAVEVLPSRHTASVRRIQVHGVEVGEAVAGQRTAVNLGGVERSELARGEVLALANSLEASALIDVDLRLLPTTRRALPARSKLIFHLGTRQQEASCVLLGSDTLAPGDSTLAQLSFDVPVVALPGDHFIVRGFEKQANYGTTIGGGVVVRVRARRLRRHDSDGIALVRRMHCAGERDRVALEVLAAGAVGLSISQLRQRLSLTAARLESVVGELLSSGKLVRYDKGGALVHAQPLAAIEARVLARVAEHHAQRPLERGIGREELRSRVGWGLGPRLFFAVLSRLERRQTLVLEHDLCRLPDHELRGSGSVERLAERLKAAYVEAGLGPPREEELGEQMGASRQQLGDAVRLLVQREELVRVSAALLFAAQALRELEVRLRTYLAQHGQIDAAAFKKLVGQSRKFAIALAEHFDKQRVTIRIGDIRRLRVSSLE